VDARWYCEYDLNAKLKKLAANINSSYDYKISDNEAIFTVTLSNIQEDLYIIDQNGKKYYAKEDMGELVFKNYEAGEKYRFDVYTDIDYCDEDSLLTIYVVLPTYNEYYTDSLCIGNEDYDLCNRWSNLGDMSDLEFQEKMNEYIATDETTAETNEDSFVMNQYLAWYLQYYVYLCSILIITSLYVIYIKKKNDKLY
jgi:hypothetical protein